MEEIINACIDSYDERTFDYEELAWAETSLPIKAICETGYRQNQKADGYNYGCVYFSTSEWTNYLNVIRTKWGDLCDKSETREEWVWDYLINWAKLALKLWLISWYGQIKSLLALKTSIVQNRPVLVWSNTINWTATKANWNIAVRWTWYWHRFHIIGYNDNDSHFICKNSYWPSYMDKGNFYIKYEDYDLLYNTKLSFIENPKLIDNYKKKIMEWITLDSAKIAFLLWIYNWDKRNEETRAIMLRAIEWMLNWKITKESIEKARKELQK